MAEVQVGREIAHGVTLGKGMHGTIYVRDEKFRLEVVPITHSKRRQTLVIRKDYAWVSPRSDNHPWVSYAPQHWIDRADEDGIGDLLAIVPYATLICRSRGKFVCFAAGPHALVICLALEYNVIGMPVEVYRSIVANDFPGPNPDRARAEKELRIFRLPDEFVTPYSSPEQRNIKILAAFVSECWAWVINDFSTTMFMRLFSRNKYWTEEDLTPGTKEWSTLFDSIERGGPD